MDAMIHITPKYKRKLTQYSTSYKQQRVQFLVQKNTYHSIKHKIKLFVFVIYIFKPFKTSQVDQCMLETVASAACTIDTRSGRLPVINYGRVSIAAQFSQSIGDDIHHPGCHTTYGGTLRSQDDKKNTLKMFCLYIEDNTKHSRSESGRDQSIVDMYGANYLLGGGRGVEVEGVWIRQGYNSTHKSSLFCNKYRLPYFLLAQCFLA